MPISEESNKISYNTDGLIREFSFNFKFLQPSNIKVSFWPKDDKDNSTKSVELEEGRDYTLIYDDAEEGGFVVLTESSAEEQAQGKPKYPATPTSGTLLVARIMPLDQQAHIRPVSGFPEEVITNTFDKLVMIDQQQQEQLDRCVKVSDVSDINPEVLVQQVERIHAGIEDIVVVADHIEDVEYVAANGEDILKASEDSLANVNAAKEQADIATEQAARAESYSRSCHNMLEDSREARDVAIEQAGVSTAQASVAAEQANIATEQANIVKEQKIIVEQLSQATNDIFLEAQSIEQKVSQDLEVSKGYAQTTLTQAGVATEQAGIAATQADIATARADEIKQYAANASISEANALNYASEASASAYNSEISERASAASATNSKVWAEGTDEEVQALGGVHSSKTWAEIGSNVGGKWGNILGDIKDQSDLQTALDKKLENQTKLKDTLAIGGDNIDNGWTTIIGFGNNAQTIYNILIGYDNYSSGDNSVCIGKWCENTGENSICIGYSAATAEQNSIQLGEGFNTTPNSFQVGEHQLLNIETGKIPDERLSNNIAKTTDIPDLTNYVKNTDYATTSSVGLVKVAAATGIDVNKEGKIYISKAPDESIVAKTEQYRPLVPMNIDLAVKTGITTNTIELTDEEKANAKDWLGISDVGGGGLPVGTIIPVTASSSHVPENTLYADGVEFSGAEGQMFRNLWTDYILTGKLDTCSYSEYETDLAIYGQCIKWAVDTANEKFRIPLIKDGSVIQQAGTNSVGKSFNAGLPNITGTARTTGTGNVYKNTGIFSGAFRATYDENVSADGYTASTASSYYDNLAFDASESNSIYGNSNTVQMNAVAVRHFIVVATGSVNQNEADWSEFASSLQGKANTDLSNTNPSASFRRDSVRWGIPDYLQQIEVEVAKEKTTFIAPYDGVIFGFQTSSTAVRMLTINGIEVFRHNVTSGTWSESFYFQVYQGDVVVVDNYSITSNTRLCFAPFRE